MLTGHSLSFKPPRKFHQRDLTELNALLYETTSALDPLRFSSTGIILELEKCLLPFPPLTLTFASAL